MNDTVYNVLTAENAAVRGDPTSQRMHSPVWQLDLAQANASVTHTERRLSVERIALYCLFSLASTTLWFHRKISQPAVLSMQRSPSRWQ